MTIEQFMSRLKPVEDIRYRVCVFDFMTGTLEAFEFERNDDDWETFQRSIPGSHWEIKEIRLSSTNDDDVVVSIVVS